MTDLGITARCWHDLEELADHFSPEVAEHVLDVFVARRGANSESGETMSGVGGPLRKLHADLSGGRSIRAVTWYDRGRDVCWLLAAGTHDVYELVERLARTDEHLPTVADIANFEADAPVRLIERVVRAAKGALRQATDHPGTEVAVTNSPPPQAFFRVEGDRLWVRVVMYAGSQVHLTTQQLVALQAAIFGPAPASQEYPDDGGQWDSIYLVGPLPPLDSWPPPTLQLVPS